MRLRTKFVASLLPLVLLPCFALAWFAYNYVEKNAILDREDYVNAYLKQSAISAEHRINMAKANIQYLSESPILVDFLTVNERYRSRTLHPILMKRLVQFRHNYPQYNEIRIVGRSGLIEACLAAFEHCASLRPGTLDNLKSLPLNQSEKQYTFIVDAEESDKKYMLVSTPLWLSNPVRDPLLERRQFEGHLLLTMSLDYVFESLADYKPRGESFLLLLNRENQVLKTKALPKLLGNGFTSSQLSDFSAGTDLGATFRNASIAGLNYFVRSVTIGNDMRLISATPKSEVTQSVQQMGIPIIVLISVVLGGTFLLIFWQVSQLIITPVKKLTASVKEVESDKTLSLSPLTSNNEIGELSRAFHRMAKSMLESQSKIQKLAYFDGLTGLPSRTSLNEQLQNYIEDSKSNNRLLAVYFIDVDNFKRINDCFGHEQGDFILKQVAQRLSHTMRLRRIKSVEEEDPTIEDSLFRLSGDEFVMVCTNLSEGEQIELINHRIIDAFKPPFNLANHEIYVCVSLGVAIYPDDGVTPQELLKHSDLAMYSAKAKGKNAFSYFHAEMIGDLNKRFTMEQDIRRALSKDEFSVYYQPKFKLPERNIVGFEALIRWHHPKQGLVLPDAFIPIAEESELICQLGELTLNSVCKQLATWRAAGITGIPISVNVSLAQLVFGRAISADKLIELLNEYGLDPHLVEIEITESTFLQDEKSTIDFLRELRNHKISVALDDFGTGYSSLSYLCNLPINILKIDRLFLQNINDSKRSYDILKSILSMANALSLETVVEGLESASQLELVEKMGCTLAQGFHLCPPISSDKATDVLKRFANEGDTSLYTG